jgi:Fe-S cluster assembly ATPase SufC
MVILDEPNSNLDSAGEQALQNALITLRKRGAITIIVAHRPAVLGCVDHILMMADGHMQAYGPKEAILAQLAAKPSAAIQKPPTERRA